MINKDLLLVKSVIKKQEDKIKKALAGSSSVPPVIWQVVAISNHFRLLKNFTKKVEFELAHHGQGSLRYKSVVGRNSVGPAQNPHRL